MNDTRVNQLLHSADPDYGIMLAGCYYLNNDEKITDLIKELPPFYVPPLQTKEIFHLLEKISDITFSGVVNSDDNRPVVILSVRADILKLSLNSIAVIHPDGEAIRMWLETPGETIQIVDIYIHCLTTRSVI
ncbi:hypothetical protein [Erwinia pyrifoliae]|uniref:hypothetical protein n=1 Tax=Erwinia pyrifoliae TaxID=79967 RepID=UPI00223AB156|nr:hypothetical protein [Erwinia pyrifoliae]MCT2387527.1 hypothetical protein [Erwinia pyrifoliae]MCU8585783.1 hypothetical protein [Erwinia pyrifoliae]